MTPSTAAKRERERQKIEKAKAKAERLASRQTSRAEETEADGPTRSEEELVEELSALHRDLEAGVVSPADFEQRRAELQAEFDRLL